MSLNENQSYVILRVARDGPSAAEFEISQKMATLLTEIEQGKGSKSAAALDFLRQTMETCNTIKQLQRYYELEGKAELSHDEKDLLEELQGDDQLAAFLPG